MSKKEKSGKVEKTTGSVAPANDAKDNLKKAKSALEKYLTKNGISIEKVPSKHKEEVDRLQRTVEKCERLMKKGKTEKSEKEKDRKVNGTNRNTKYEYPKGMDDPDERKKYRAKMRSEANKGEKTPKKKEISKPSKEAKTSSKKEIAKPEKTAKVEKTGEVKKKKKKK